LVFFSFNNIKINIIKDNINNIKIEHYKINIFQKPLLNDIFVSLNNVYEEVFRLFPIYNILVLFWFVLDYLPPNTVVMFKTWWI